MSRPSNLTHKFISTRFFIYFLVLTAVILFEYGHSFNFYFFGDDFMFIDFVLRRKSEILSSSPSPTHYYPLGVSLNALPAFLGILDPRAYTIINFFFFLLGATLVMMVHRELSGSLKGGFFAALIFSTALPNAEIIYWKTCIQTIAMTCFSMIALLFFIRYLERGARKALLYCACALAASMLCMEQGILAFGILFFYDIIFFLPSQMRGDMADRKLAGIRFLGRHAVLICVPLILSLLKMALRFPLTPTPLADRALSRLLLLTIEAPARMIDFNNILLPTAGSSSTFRLVAYLLLLFFAAYALVRRSRALIFFLISAMGTILLVSLSANSINPRYFCLPLVYYSCFLSMFTMDLAALSSGLFGKIRARAPMSSINVAQSPSRLQCAIVGIVCLTIAFQGLRGVLDSRAYWELSSRIQKNIADSVQTYYTAEFGRDDHGRMVYLLNIPDYLKTEKYYSFFYVTRGGLIEDIQWRLRTSKNKVERISTGDFFLLPFEGENIMYKAAGRRNRMTKEDVMKLIKQGNLVLWFSPRLLDVLPMTEFGAFDTHAGIR